MTTAQPSPAIDGHPVPVPHDRVALRGFWGRWQEVVRTVTIPAQHRTMLGTGHLAAFRLAWKPGQPQEPHIFWDSDTAKWIEAAAHCLAAKPDPALEALLDEVAALVASAQQPDGYLNTHFTVVAPELRWTDTRDAHELYCAGHLIEAAVAHWRATGKRVLLDVARRLSTCIAAAFGREPGKKPGYCGHEEIELALVKLYRATDERAHLDLARYFVDQRGTSPNWFEAESDARGIAPEKRAWTLAYYQAAVPVRELSHADGHAVRAMYLYCAMADLVAETGDAGLLLALDRLWDSAVGRRMYVTGSVGSSHHGEAFTRDHDLPNRTAYCETCAAIGLAFWAHRMLALRQDGRYGDVLERALHNGALAGIALDGTRFFYVNPLASDGGHHRQEWFGCACCPPNIARLIASLGGYAYAAGRRELWVHLYAAGRARLEVAGASVALDVETGYPWDGRVTLRLEPEREVEFGLRLRIPGWCRGARVTVNGQPFHLAAATRNGYLRIDRRWHAGDVVELELPMPVERTYAHPAVVEDRGRVALTRGPLVYCLEAADNGSPLDAVTLPRTATLTARAEPGLLGGVTVIEGQALEPDPVAGGSELYRGEPPPTRRRQVTAIPYYAWDNRVPGEMQVWLRES